MDQPAAPRLRQPRSDGLRSREAILTAAAKLASVRGFDGLSIGALAEHLGMSKSGLFAHFGSKDELELATVQYAQRIFGEQVTSRVGAAPPGLDRLLAITDAYFQHLRDGFFPGGCFFAAVAAELVARPGRTRDKVFSCIADWVALLTRCFQEASELGQLRPDADLPQAVFEAHALLSAANTGFHLTGDPAVFDRARTGIQALTDRLRRA